jgi:hypothetical protein
MRLGYKVKVMKIKSHQNSATKKYKGAILVQALIFASKTNN